MAKPGSGGPKKPAGGGPKKAMTLSERFSQISKIGRGGAAVAATGIGKRRQVTANTQQASRHAKQMAARTGQPAKKGGGGGATAMQTDGAGRAKGKGKGGPAAVRGGRAKPEPAAPVDKDALDGDLDSYWKNAGGARATAADAAAASADADVLTGVPDSVVPDTDAAMTTA